MRRFDVYRNEATGSARRFPYLLVLQSDLLQDLATTVVAPLGRPSVVGGKLVGRLAPELEISSERYVMYTPELAAIPASILRKHVTNIENQRESITRALDLLFSGI